MAPTSSRESAVQARLRLAAWSGFAALVVARAWVGRADLLNDGPSYLDMADKAAAGQWTGLVNGYFSPLYPALISLMFRLVHPSPYWELAWVHLVNVLIYAGVLAAFEYFLRETNELALKCDSVLRSHAWLGVAYILFIFTFTEFDPPELLTPDALMAIFLLLAAGMLARARRQPLSLWGHILFGVVLGFGYLAKAPMLPIGLLLLALVAMPSGRTNDGSAASAPPATRFVRAGVATLIFLVVAMPYVLALSSELGHFSAGESGPLNYAWLVNGARRNEHWRGEPAGSGIPLHPTRKLFSDPELFEFATPIVGTYPPWTDPTYWNAGLKPHFNLRQQVSVLFATTGFYLLIFLREMGALTVVILALVIASRRDRLRDALRRTWPPLLLGVAVFGMYGLVHIESQYIAAAWVIFWTAVMATIPASADESGRGFQNSAAIALCLVIVVILGQRTTSQLRTLRHSSEREAWTVAQELSRMGVAPGDRVAMLGWEISWARPSRTRIVAEIPEPQADLFWAAPPERRQEVIRLLRSTGAKVLVAGPLAMPCHGGCALQRAPTAGMVPVANTGFWVLPLNP